MRVPSHRASAALDHTTIVGAVPQVNQPDRFSVVEPHALARIGTSAPHRAIPAPSSGRRCRTCHTVMRGTMTPGNLQCQQCNSSGLGTLIDIRRGDHPGTRRDHMTLITRPTPEDPTTHTASCAGQTRSQHGRTDRRRASPGQALVEFAVLVPVLVMILVVAADFGRALTAYIAISGAAREGAAYGMQSTIQAVDGDGIRAAALADIGSGGEIWGTDVEVSPSIGPIDGQGYYQVVVEVSYTFSPMFPIPELPSTLPMERTVTMRVLQ